MNCFEKMVYEKKMDFNQVDQLFISSVASRKNKISRISLQYTIPLEVFLSYMNEYKQSNLILTSK